MERLGIYGGTFSPPHSGHIHAAKAFISEMALDRLLVIPTFIPPHKSRSELTSPEDRLAMCRRAFSFSKKIEVSDMEIARGGKSYTSDTLTALKKEGRELYFLCGTDMLLSIDRWHEPRIIFELAHIVCVAREDDLAVRDTLYKKAEYLKAEYGARVHILPVDSVELSSSEVREMISKNEVWESRVPSNVAAYIKEKGLYR